MDINRNTDFAKKDVDNPLLDSSVSKEQVTVDGSLSDEELKSLLACVSEGEVDKVFFQHIRQELDINALSKTEC